MKNRNRLQWLSLRPRDEQSVGSPENAKRILAGRHRLHRIQLPGTHLKVNIEMLGRIVAFILCDIEAGLPSFYDRNRKSHVHRRRFDGLV